MVDAYISSLKALTLRPKFTESRACSPPTVELAPDEQLISELWLGDKDAIGELFKRHSGAIFRIGLRLLCDSGEAEDLVQEVFLYIFRRSKLFDPSKGRARSWIFQIAYTQALSRRRKLKSIGFYSPNGDQLSDLEATTGARSVYDSTLEGFFGQNGWQRIIGELTKDQRETLRLHFFEGLTFAEIAEKLGQSHRNIRNHHYRGLEKLRKYIAKSKLNVP